ncbi:glycerol-3-phosphate dehydrogenase [Streptomyces sp. DvalAA-14]|uniref:glycerol-3-phosphate dehydrogenase/oxidase n=1 Tax=unclassified Streptomyces TaxID=2593676 RepID=UPI00081B937E|nr:MULTISPECIES: glycerol-3-phosphate dehydrogenase/oxidase [unclassified Streptomyces]MYS22905.1 FAD-dependent oxidoreductase [Streptomyces sp. SID4948]SCE24271.1 glycerol-3-phosphate dehydrogenase [Streptomyces sp. DvalAA-14]
MRAATLGPQARKEALTRMAEHELDVLVVGGGVVGAGAALDAATRGLATGLVEGQDWAAGTSSRATKLIHGGLRYLEMLDFALVREAIKERGLLHERLAPHLVKPVPILYPLQHRGWERIYVGAGIALYDGMAVTSGHNGLPLHRHLSRRHALRLAPGLKKEGLVGAIQFYDAQVEDARLVTTVIRTAASYGALTANRARVASFIRADGRVVGAVVHDTEDGTSYEIHARRVVNATGVWTDDMQGLIEEHPQFNIKASKGVHLMVPKDRIRSDTGMILRTEKSVLFVLPWGRHWIVGTTDTPWTLDKADPAASQADIDYVLDHVNTVLANPLTREDVESVYVGLRPLIAATSAATSKLSREHAVTQPAPGLVVVAGGKFTTYRVMGKDAVDEAVRDFPAKVAPSCTENVPLAGADGYYALLNTRQLLADRNGIHVVWAEHLINRYGSLVDEVLALIREDRGLAEPLRAANGYLRAEVVYAVTHEGARHLDDVLVRRTRISIETFDRGKKSAREAAELMAPLLGWDETEAEKEIQTYVDGVNAELEAERQPDDDSADDARTHAADIVPMR